MKRDKVLGELVTFENPHGFHLDGILYQDNENRTTIIHVHGSLGNFYQNKFLRIMAKMYRDAGINLLAFNLASHDGVCEGYKHEKDFEYVGGSIADFSRCVYDIEGAISFASTFSDKIILQGHSLGCDRILYYLITSKAKYDFILLAPCDSYQLHANWIAPETVEHQIKRVKEHYSNEELFDWLPIKEYGIRQGNELYHIPITRKAWLSIAEGPPFELIRLSSPYKFYLENNALIYIAGRDDLQTWPSESMFKYFEERVRHVTRVYVPNGDHCLCGCENEVIESIIHWYSQSG